MKHEGRADRIIKGGTLTDNPAMWGVDQICGFFSFPPSVTIENSTS